MTLSAAGKVDLVNSNLIGIPQYFMNWFKIPKYICRDIYSVNRDFFEKIIVGIIILINMFNVRIIIP